MDLDYLHLSVLDARGHSMLKNAMISEKNRPKEYESIPLILTLRVILKLAMVLGSHSR